MRVFIIDDEKINRITLVDFLNSTDEYEATECIGAEEALVCLDIRSYDIALVDYKMPGMDGLEFLRIAKERHPDMDVVLMTAYGTVDVAVESMKMGALDFIQKPFTTEELLVKLDRYTRHKEIVKENILLKKELQDRFSFHKMVGKSNEMVELFAQAMAFSESESSVLLIGESGTGKGLLARALHYAGKSKKKPFIEIHCGAIAGNVLESELFGHAKGSFTGAIREREGKLEAAKDGTVYLDDIDSLPLELQAKLLRVLQENEFERVGSNRTIKLKARILASVKPAIKEKVSADEFREDLYHRLNVLNLVIPPLRERTDDVHVLAGYFINKYKDKVATEVERFSAPALNALMEYAFPGNVREFEHLVERLLHTCKGKEILLSDLPPEICSPDTLSFNVCLKQVDSGELSLNQLVEKTERKFISWALEKSGNNQSKAAKFLDLPRSTLQEKIKKYGLNSGVT